MNPIDQVLATALELEANGKTPSLALIKTRLGNSLPLPILIQGLQQFKSTPKAERERLTTLQMAAPTQETPATAPPLTLTLLADRLVAQQAHFEHIIEQQRAEIALLKKQLTELNKKVSQLNR